MEESKKEKVCGNCCWFYSEDTDGWGYCAAMKGEDIQITNCCDLCTVVGSDGKMSYVSRVYQRHCQAVLARSKRYYDTPDVLRYIPTANDCKEAIRFAYKYISVMSKL